MTGIEDMPQSTPVPDWVAAGAWKRRGLATLELLRGNIITLCLTVTYISARWHGLHASLWDILIAVILDYGQRRLCWSLRLDPVDIYKNSISSGHDFLPRSRLERWRLRKPVFAHLILGALLFLPVVFLHYSQPWLPAMFAGNYLAYMVLIIAPFQFMVRSEQKYRGASLPPGMSIPEFVRSRRELDLSGVHFYVQCWLFFVLPFVVFILFLSASKTGYSDGQIACSLLVFMCVLQADGAIYVAKVYFVAGYHPEKQ